MLAPGRREQVETGTTGSALDYVLQNGLLWPGIYW